MSRSNKWDGWCPSPKDVICEVRKLKGEIKYEIRNISIAKWSLDKGYEYGRPIWRDKMETKEGESREDVLVSRLFDLSVGCWHIVRMRPYLGGVEIEVNKSPKGMPEPTNITIGVIKAIVGLTR